MICSMEIRSRYVVLNHIFDGIRSHIPTIEGNISFRNVSFYIAFDLLLTILIEIPAVEGVLNAINRLISGHCRCFADTLTLSDHERSIVRIRINQIETGTFHVLNFKINLISLRRNQISNTVNMPSFDFGTDKFLIAIIGARRALYITPFNRIGTYSTSTINIIGILDTIGICQNRIRCHRRLALNIAGCIKISKVSLRRLFQIYSTFFCVCPPLRILGIFCGRRLLNIKICSNPLGFGIASYSNFKRFTPCVTKERPSIGMLNGRRSWRNTQYRNR